MIGQLIDAASRRARAADAVTLADETVSVGRTAAGDEASRVGSFTAHLRIEDGGRRGIAVRDDPDVDGLVQAALRSARTGAPGHLLLPVSSPLPIVTTSHPGAAVLDTRALRDLADRLQSRLEKPGRSVNTWAERSAGRVEVANSRGVMAGYDTTMVGLGLTVRFKDQPAQAPIRLHESAVVVPGEETITSLADEAQSLLAPPLLDEPPPTAPLPLWLGPRAVAALLVPVRQALLAREVWAADGPLGHHLGERVLSEAITLSDDPLADGRPGSRPIDDDGVVCHRTVLIHRGVLKGALCDLETAERLGIPATGHACRGAGFRPWIGWSNLVMEPGVATRRDLVEASAGGVYVHDLPRASGNLADGRVAWSTPWAYRVEGAGMTGRYERFLLRGNAFDMLNRVVALGATTRWIGGHCLPDVVLELRQQ